MFTSSMKFLVCISISLSLATFSCVGGQDNSNAPSAPDLSKMTSKERFHSLWASTPAYRKEAVRVLIREANRVAEELRLPEQLPITETNLVGTHITPPRLAHGIGVFGIGNITTSNYTYYVSVGNKFSFLAKRNLEQDYRKLQAQALLPMSRMDTNAAYRLATQVLAAASMDVKALNRDCSVRVTAFTPEGANGEHFVPVYWVSWVANGQEGHGSMASVELFEPTRTVRQLRVEESEYTLRKPLEISNVDFLLSQTNNALQMNVPPKK